MDVLILLLFVSAVLVLGALLLFAKAISGGDFEHGDRLALLPLEQERGGVSSRGGGRAASRHGGVVGCEIAPCRADQAIESGEEIHPHE